MVCRRSSVQRKGLPTASKFPAPWETIFPHNPWIGFARGPPKFRPISTVSVPTSRGRSQVLEKNELPRLRVLPSLPSGHSHTLIDQSAVLHYGNKSPPNPVQYAIHLFATIGRDCLTGCSFLMAMRPGYYASSFHNTSQDLERP